MDAAAGADPSTGHYVDERALGRGLHPAVGVWLPAARHLAHRLPDVWPARRRLGHPLRLVVSRQPAPPPPGQCRRGRVAARRNGNRRPFQSAVEKNLHFSNRLVPVRSIFRLQLLFLFFHHLVSYLPPQSARPGCEKQRVARRHAAVRRRFRRALRRLALTDSEPPLRRRRQGPARNWRRGCGRRRRSFDYCHTADQSLSRRCRHCAGRFLQRHPVARRLDRLHGRGRQVRRHPLGHDEYDGQLRRFRLPDHLRENPFFDR